MCTILFPEFGMEIWYDTEYEVWMCCPIGYHDQDGPIEWENWPDDTNGARDLWLMMQAGIDPDLPEEELAAARAYL